MSCRKFTLIAQRRIYDSTLTLGVIENLNIDKDLIFSFRSARSKYENAMKDKLANDADGKKKKDEEKLRKLRLLELQEEKQNLLYKTDEHVKNIEKEMKKLQKWFNVE